jgi:hypothetical protein
MLIKYWDDMHSMGHMALFMFLNLYLYLYLYLVIHIKKKQIKWMIALFRWIV